MRLRSLSYAARTARTAVMLSLIVAPAALGLAWLGCATAGEDVDAAPKRPPKADTGIGSTDETSTPNPDGGGALCTNPTAASNSCATATDLGTLNAGGTKTLDEGIAEVAGDLWYKVTFADLEKVAAHPRVLLTSPDANVFMEVNKTCAGELAACGEEGTTATKVKDYEVRYAWDAGVAPEAGGPEAGVFKPIQVGEGGSVYIHVFRAPDGPKTGCTFKLEITN